MGRKRPPRIPGFDYLGCHAYFLTICAESRQQFFTSRECGDSVCAELLRTAAGYTCAVIAYCLMPDHLHALIEGVAENSDFRKFVAMFKQRTSYAHRRRSEKKLWQEGYYDHVLRDEEPAIGVAAYILHNPIRAGLSRTLEGYPLLGSGRYTLEQLSEAIQFDPRRSRP
jgi:putative transposase